MNYLAVMKPSVLIAAVAAVVGTGVWACMTYTVMKTVIGGDYIVVTEKQAKECKEGGGCAIFSEREFDQTVRMILAQRGKSL